MLRLRMNRLAKEKEKKMKFQKETEQSYSWFNAEQELIFSGIGPSNLLFARFLVEDS